MCRVKLDIKYTPNPTREQASLGRFSFLSLFRINTTLRDSTLAVLQSCGPLQFLTMPDLDAFVRVGRCIYEEAGVGETMVKEAIKRSAGSEVCTDWERGHSRGLAEFAGLQKLALLVHAIRRAGQKRGGARSEKDLIASVRVQKNSYPCICIAQGTNMCTKCNEM